MLPRHIRRLATLVPTAVVKRGDLFRSKDTFSQERVLAFLKLTGDGNAIHSSRDAATAAGPIVPGMLCASLFPAIIARNFPGAVYLTQTLQFRKPAPVGSLVRAEMRVTQVQGRHVRFDTTCTAADGSRLIEGVALARL